MSDKPKHPRAVWPLIIVRLLEVSTLYMASQYLSLLRDHDNYAGYYWGYRTLLAAVMFVVGAYFADRIWGYFNTVRRSLILMIAAFCFLVIFGCCHRPTNHVKRTQSIRPLTDTEGGYSTTPEQIEKVVALAEAIEGNFLRSNAEKHAGKRWIAGISPHDAHLLAGRVYVHLFQNMRAKRFVIFAEIGRIPSFWTVTIIGKGPTPPSRCQM